MTEAAAGILKIIFFLLLGVSFRKLKWLGNESVGGIKTLVVNLAIPAVLYSSFAQLEIDLRLLPVTMFVLGINLISFLLGFLFYKAGIVRNRLVPLVMSTMNFGLLGIPLFEAVHGIDNLHHYSMFGLGVELYMWFLFYFILHRFLGIERVGSGTINGFFRSPIIWSILLGCLSSIVSFDISSSHNVVLSGLSKTITGAAQLAGPLIMIFIGFTITVDKSLLKRGLKLLAVRLSVIVVLAYLLKFAILNRFISPSVYYESSFFLLMTLPPVFSLPLLTADHLDKNELSVMNNYIILHAVFTIILYSLYSLVI